MKQSDKRETFFSLVVLSVVVALVTWGVIGMSALISKFL